MKIRKWNEWTPKEKSEWNDYILLGRRYTENLVEKTIEIAMRETREPVEEPEIIGRVMRRDGKDYFHLPTTEPCDVDGSFCNECKQQHARRCADEGWAWKLFDNVTIDDELAKLRPWVIVGHNRLPGINPCRILFYVNHGTFVAWDNTRRDNEIVPCWDSCRLANVDDLKKAGVSK